MKIRITQQGDLLQVQPIVNRTLFKRRQGNREATTRFSDRSRNNLLQKFARIDKEKCGRAVFITLTYISNQQNAKKAKNNLRAFMERIRRLKDANGSPVGEKVWGFWRMETQKRGAIHFHLMLFNLPFISKIDIANWWGEITGEWQFFAKEKTGHTWYLPPFTRIEMCQSVRKTWYYLSKYVAKRESDDSHAENVGLTSAQNCTRLSSPGRWWGVFNGDEVPYAQEVVAEIVTDWKMYQRFRWDLAQVLPHTREVHLTHTVKAFTFFDLGVDPVLMMIAAIEGRPVFGYGQAIR